MFVKLGTAQPQLVVLIKLLVRAENQKVKNSKFGLFDKRGESDFSGFPDCKCTL